jgi:hypothetical protein
MSITLSNSPAKVDLTIYQGASFAISLTATDEAGNLINWTGYAAKAQVRENFQATHSVLTFAASPLGSNGVVALSATTAQTVSLQTNKEYVWDFKVDNGTEVDVPFTGVVSVEPRVSR